MMGDGKHSKAVHISHSQAPRSSKILFIMWSSLSLSLCFYHCRSLAICLPLDLVTPEHILLSAAVQKRGHS